jgi:hypothetical protein
MGSANSSAQVTMKQRLANESASAPSFRFRTLFISSSTSKASGSFHPDAENGLFQTGAGRRFQKPPLSDQKTNDLDRESVGGTLNHQEQ